MKHFLFVVASLLAANALAAPITVSNPSFETDGTGAYPADWNGSCGSCGTFIPIPSHFNTAIPDGTRTLYANQTVGLNQILTTTLAADTVYTLTVFVGHRNDDSATFAGSNIQLRAGATFGGSVLLAQGIDLVTPLEGEWLQATLPYVSPTVSPLIGQNLIIFLGGSTLGTTQVHFDQVALDGSPTPEPAVFFSVGLGLIAVSLLRRRQMQ